MPGARYKRADHGRPRDLFRRPARPFGPRAFCAPRAPRSRASRSREPPHYPARSALQARGPWPPPRPIPSARAPVWSARILRAPRPPAPARLDAGNPSIIMPVARYKRADHGRPRDLFRRPARPFGPRAFCALRVPRSRASRSREPQHYHARSALQARGPSPPPRPIPSARAPVWSARILRAPRPPAPARLDAGKPNIILPVARYKRADHGRPRDLFRRPARPFGPRAFCAPRVPRSRASRSRDPQHYHASSALQARGPSPLLRPIPSAGAPVWSARILRAPRPPLPRVSKPGNPTLSVP